VYFDICDFSVPKYRACHPASSINRHHNSEPDSEKEIVSQADEVCFDMSVLFVLRDSDSGLAV
jgi:hypothetical protein